jgi:hypothetical protein
MINSDVRPVESGEIPRLITTINPTEQTIRKSVSPEEAAKLLQANTGNRPLKARQVERFARAMRDGRWRFNPADAIVIDRNGQLRNGQHRLQAVIASGVTVEFQMCLGADPELFEVLDTGIKRGGADILAIHGVPQCALINAALRWIGKAQAARARAQRGAAYRLVNPEVIDNDQIIRLWEKHTGIQDSVRIVDRLIPKRLIPPSVIVWLHYRFTAVNPNLAATYLDGIATGNAATKGEPEFAVRRFLLNNLSSNTTVDPETIAAIIIKGWNKRSRNEPMHNAHWDAAKEGFPQVLGEDVRASLRPQSGLNGKGGSS